MDVPGTTRRVRPREALVWLCVLACVLNIVLVAGLAGAGVLKSTERGDIQYTDTQTRPGGNIAVSEGSSDRFAIESPTDADAYYNAVVRVQSGGPLINDWNPDNVQEFHYLPVTYFAFAALAAFGYVWFKIALFVASLLATVAGTYLLLGAETGVVGVDLSRRARLGLALASCGFAPMVANFKVGQVTPFAYLSAAVAWWAYRNRGAGGGGVAVALPALLKPYWAISLVVFASPEDRRWLGVVGFGATVAIANALSAATFGLDTTLQYYGVLAESAAAESGGSVPITEWSVEALRPFWFAGAAATLFRLASALPFALLWLRYARRGRDRDAVALYALSVAVLFTLLSSTTLIDLGVGLVAFVVLGTHLYGRGGRAFGLLVAAFLLAHAHTYAMEVLVGNGHVNLIDIVGPTPVLKLLQPGAYAVLLLYGLALWWAFDEGASKPAGS